VPLEIAGRDLAEDACEAGRRVAIFRQIGRFQQVLADLRARRRRHLLDADDQHHARRLRLDGAHGLMHGRRAGGAGVLDTRRGLEPQLRVRLQHERRREILRGKPGVEMPQHDLVDIISRDACMRQRLVGDAHDQAFDALGVQLSEGRMRPAHDGSRHGAFLR
jgi:hypothetical protein